MGSCSLFQSRTIFAIQCQRSLLFKDVLSLSKNTRPVSYSPTMSAVISRQISIGSLAPKSSRSLKKEYVGRKLVGYSMEAMFDVVADVGNYKKFLPFCKQSTVLSQSEHHLKADLVIGFPPIVEAYTSNVSLVRPNLVKAVASECRIIKHLVTTWKFSPALANSADTCIIDFYVSFEFRSALHSQLAHFFFNELVRQMEQAFYQEAKKRYGAPTIETQFLGAPSSSS